MGTDHSRLSWSWLQISFTRQVIVVVVGAAVVAVVVLLVAAAAVVEYRACQRLFAHVQKLFRYII
jgi:uncharacterized membrane protein YcjF (UPF0283 family)